MSRKGMTFGGMDGGGPSHARLMLLTVALSYLGGCSSAGSVGGSGDAQNSSLDATVITLGAQEAGGQTDGCAPLTQLACASQGGRYCGTIGDNCNGTLECGGCLNGQSCVNDICGGIQVDCDAGGLTTCQVPGGQYCGSIGNGCGGRLECGACPGDDICTANVCKGGSSCVPVTCGTGAGKYCGTIGDDCGGSLDCATCVAGEICQNHQCVPAGVCTPLTCRPTGGQYCGGVLGDGCGGTLSCDDDCPAGWQCTSHLCQGGSSCVEVACGTGSGKYCGSIGDGCGRSEDCGACIAGETCQKGQCAPVNCSPLTCNPAGGQYCGGEIGDGCGGEILCAADCPAGWSCNNHLCVGGSSCVPLTCSAGSVLYCGLIGNGCGGGLDCGTCPSGEVCTNNLCVAQNCTPVTCASPGGQYCGGTLGDGCGGTLNCNAACPNGWSCQNHLCVGGPTCAPVACNSPGGQYCGGTLGDGCGGSINCSADCPSGWSCQGNQCVSGSSCAPVTCSNPGGDYCGVVGDGCGHALACDSDCGAGKQCSNHLCVSSSACVPLTCVASTGGQYCGGVIGDGCGGSIACNADCPTGAICQDHVCVCSGIQCQVARCDAGTTTVAGKVYDPAGINPLYGAMVYIPNTTLDPIAHGPTCAGCATPSGQPISAALSGTDGSFALGNVPSGSNIPLVVQIGKWRRQVKIPTVNACQNNVLTDINLTRLPRNQTDGDAGTVSLPTIALASGAADKLQCLLLRMGISPSEFTNPGGTGAISFYQQSESPGTCVGYDQNSITYPMADTNLWDSTAHLGQYDMVILNCGGNPDAYDPTNASNVITDAMKQNMVAYVNAGGRVFAEHFHWAWIRTFKDATTTYASPFTDVATWIDPINIDTIGSGPRATTIDQSLPKGQAFASWLANVGASSTKGTLVISQGVKYSAVDQIVPKSQRWIYEPIDYAKPTGAAQYTHYFSFNAPVGADPTSQCGRFVYTGLHVSDVYPGFTPDPGNTSFPSCCTTQRGLSPQEKALEFMLFDLSSCISNPALPPSTVPTLPPPVAPPVAPPFAAPPAEPLPVLAAPPSAPPLPVLAVPPPAPPPPVTASPPPAPPPRSVAPPPPLPPPPAPPPIP